MDKGQAVYTVIYWNMFCRSNRSYIAFSQITVSFLKDFIIVYFEQRDFIVWSLDGSHCQREFFSNYSYL
jgi:hypothetical protein